MRFHPVVLRGDQEKLLRRLGPVAHRLGFSLGGGIAIALQLGHRGSLDLDWFRPRRIADPARLGADLRSSGLRLTDLRIEEGFLAGHIDGIEVSFAPLFYPMLRRPVPLPRWGCTAFSLDDLSAMKLAAAATRVFRRDFIDIYALGIRHKPLISMLRLYSRRFRTRDLTHVIYALTSYDTAERSRIPKMIWKVPWSRMRATVERWALDRLRIWKL